MGGTIGRVALGLGTFGASEGFGIRPLLEQGSKALTPKIPVPTVPKIPTESAPAVQQASAEAARRRSGARGFQSTILTKLAEASGLKSTIGS